MMPQKKNGVTQSKRQCYMCLHNIRDLDYKDTNVLRRFLSSFAKIVPRKRSGVCASHQREIAHCIKLARFMALLPYIQR